MLTVERERNRFTARIPSFSGPGLRVQGARLRRAAQGDGVVRVAVSGSKSFTSRALVLAGMCPNPVLISGMLWSDDSYWGLHALESLGFGLRLDFPARQVWISPPVQHPPSGTEVHFGMAGTLARFFPAVILNFAKTFPHLGTIDVLATGSARLSERPLADLMGALRQLGGQCEGDALPVRLTSSSLSGSCTISGAKSGQFLSGLLLAAAGARAPISIARTENLVQPDYVRMTIQALQSFGADVTFDADLRRFSVDCSQGLSSREFTVEADASTACYFLAFAVLHDIDLEVVNIGEASLQPDVAFTEFLQRLGGKLTVETDRIRVSQRGVGPGRELRGGFTLDFSRYSDQGLTAGVLALFADAPIEVTGIEHIRAHESDRIRCLCENLAHLGVNVEERQDGFVVRPGADVGKLQGTWQTFGDHRFAMAGFLVASLAPEVAIASPDCVEKTAPDFFEVFASLGVQFG